MHAELENEDVATTFDNKLLNLRATFTQRGDARFTGTSGVHFFHRDYSAEGEEALSPPVLADGIALFTLQEIDLKSARVQLGGRIDHTNYDPKDMASRSFTGFSGAAGLHLPLGGGAAFVANYTHSYRAPAIEELYNHGPHIGNLVYEIGDTALVRESADGIDLSLRHQNARIKAEANFYCYGIRDFVYLSLTGATEHGLREAAYSQGNARFIGGEALVGVQLVPDIWLNAALDKVSAELTATGTPLPRIPPLRTRVGIDARWRGFSLRPEIVIATAQESIYPTESRTPGYATVNLDASYMLARTHFMHVFSMNVFNVGDRLYRNHLSFIKDLAPEMGRGVKFSYSLRFF
jgi:iron complex outermembrane receptor protein